MTTLTRTLLSLSLTSLFAACAPTIPPPNPQLDVNTKRLPGTVQLLSNLQDNYTFYAKEPWQRRRQPFKADINVGKSSHHLFVAGLRHLFDQEPTALDDDYQLIPSVAYRARHEHPGPSMWWCEASVRYGALIRHRDGRTMEFDSGWAEANYKEKYTFSSYDPLTYCYWAAFARAEEQAFHALAQKISASPLFAAPSSDSHKFAPVMTADEWATEYADTKIKLDRLADALRKEVSANWPRRWTILGPFTSIDKSLTSIFSTYVRGQVYGGTGRTVGFEHLYWTLNQYAIPFQDLTNISPVRVIPENLRGDSILLGTLTTEEPWIKVRLSLYDISSGSEIASKETKLYKNVALRAILERGEIPPDCQICKHPYFTPP